MPMKQPGIDVRPITQIDGSAEFNEVYFDEARCPRANVVGGDNNGWKVAMTTLGLRAGLVGHHRAPPLPEGARQHHRHAPGAAVATADPVDPPGPGPGLVQGEDHADQRLPDV